MFPPFAPKSFHLSQYPNGNPYYPPHEYPLAANIDGQTCEVDFEDTLDNHQILTNQSSNYQEGIPTEFNTRSMINGNLKKHGHVIAACVVPTNEFGLNVSQNLFKGVRPHKCLSTISPLHLPPSPPSLLHASSKTPQNGRWNDQIPVIEETITIGSSSKSSHDNFYIHEGMRERVHAKPKFAFRMKTKLEVVDDGYKWIKYGKKKVKSSPHPRNYFKCSTIGCNVKKRIERDIKDSSYVITTYDGVHNHKGFL